MAMRPIIGIAGAGAVGGHYGLALLRAGCGVRFLARGAHLQAMKNIGLHHVSGNQSESVRVDCGDDPALLSGCTVVILSCKTTQLDEMMAAIAPYVDDAVLLTMQNGVQAPDLLHQRFPQHEIIAASAFIGVRIDPVGTIIHSAAGHIRLGAWNTSDNTTANILAKAWQSAGVDAQTITDMPTMLWHKMLWNCGFNAISALTQRHARDLADDDAINDWVKAAMKEVETIANCEGILLKPRAIEQHLAMTLLAGAVKTSMWQDVIHHRPTEIAAMNGHIVHLAKKHGRAVPVNALLSDLLNMLSHQPT